MVTFYLQLSPFLVTIIIMSRTKNPSLQREQLDRKFTELHSAPLRPPSKGWIRAIRESLGMSLAQLAHRLGVPRQNIHRIEQSELAGHVNVATLKKIAEQLSCDLYVTLVPKTTLKATIEVRAHEVAKKILERTQLHMGLENQNADEDFIKSKINSLADELIRASDKKLWDEI